MAPAESSRERDFLMAATNTVLEGGRHLPEPDESTRTAARVDLQRFMGDWHVIASVPTPLERGIRDAVESYRLLPDGTVATTVRYRTAVKGQQRALRFKGFVRPGSGNAVWGMQLVWPLQAEYRIMFVDRDYSQAVIGRSRRDYAWILSRTPSMPNRDFFRRVKLLRDEGFKTDRLRMMPQSGSR